MTVPAAADLVVVGAGTIGGWAAHFAAGDGADTVVVEQGLAGGGASSRAAGIVRAQAGTAAAAALGRWSIDFYRSQPDRLGTDSGFRPLGYLLLATRAREAREGRARAAQQQSQGLDVQWLDPPQVERVAPLLATTGHLGGTYRAADGCIDPVRNVRCYSLALQRAGVRLLERTLCLGLRTETRRGSTRVTGLVTSAGTIATPRVLLTGGPTIAELGRRCGVRIPVGAVRHQVAVTAPHPAFLEEPQTMVYDMAKGLYWREEEGGLLFGMSNPDESPGPASAVDWRYLARMRRRVGRWVPLASGLELRKVWAATIDYTADHLPILGPGLDRDRRPIGGLTVAAPGGHGMMWGPAVARVGADLALHGRTDLVDVADLGLGRFDAEQRSRVAGEPIALPFPVMVEASA
ncbi:MAG TPA: FAD-binding oxidoreductase [Candidatus Micrarchaeia archaeon]|nr:FAD-binding oxidoreductase [Candidatus Micrarchaeia archaeon]